MKAPTVPLLRFLAGTTPSTCRQCAPKTYIKRLSTSAPLRAKWTKPNVSKKVKPLPYSPPRKPPPKQSNPTAANSPPAPPNPMRHRTLPLLLGSLTAFTLAGYSSYIYVTYRRATSSPSSSSHSVPLDVSERYNDIATEFDGDVEWMEWSMGLLKLRKEMASKARGAVCEVSVGTGRNMGFYEFGPLMTGVEMGKGGKKDGEEEEGTVTSFTAVDKSPQMIAVAREKFSREHPGVRGVQWVVQDASLPLPPPPSSSSPTSSAPEKYDTILQTMGLCSTPHPAALLLNLSNHLAPGGRILLLEHGRGYWGWLNNILDALAPGHAERFGCWWNREVGGILEEVEKGGLRVVEVRRRNWGTTWWLELRRAEDEEKE
ncbi:hypothetical protein VC83_01260 [Pseudogymnoascus destructans]|uniref:Uncharacterized protein n=1 Tax=Pseudogymnoascus destructans TaxID=655981 RepID=A0A177AML3_9PEZI|nr:uncharacterized protein VC83_01260 [Pseudogymnoascus destructans]OAF62732.1 hypothetical protein VC83_01260 [Pseudogymnoascus destructans]